MGSISLFFSPRCRCVGATEFLQLPSFTLVLHVACLYTSRGVVVHNE